MSKENQKKQEVANNLSLSGLATNRDLYSDLTSFLKYTDLLNLSSTNSFFKNKTKEFLLKKIKNELTEKFTLANNKTVEKALKEADELIKRFFNLNRNQSNQLKTVASILLLDITKQGFEKLFEKVWTYCLDQGIFTENDLRNLKNKNTDGNLLNSAVQSGNSKMVGKIIEKKIPVGFETIKSGMIPIKLAESLNRAASAIISTIMIGGGNVQCNIATPQKNSSLLTAAKLKYWDCVEEILKGEYTYNLAEREALTNNTLLHYLCEAGQTDIVSQLISIDNEAVQEQMNSINFKEKTPLDLARNNNHENCTALLIPCNQPTFGR